jgi:hypothetical protein
MRMLMAQQATVAGAGMVLRLGVVVGLYTAPGTLQRPCPSRQGRH